MKPKLNRPKLSAAMRLPAFRLTEVVTSSTDAVDWGLELAGVPQAWIETEGRGVTVAMIDSGAAYKHPDLAGAIVDARDFTGSASGPSDLVGHGTHVSGIVGARRNNHGIVGVAPQCGLLVGRVVADDQSISEDHLVEAVEWSVSRGADVISLSLGSPYPLERLRAALLKAIQKGRSVVCAGGNSGPQLNSVQYPGRYDEVITVGSVNREGNVSFDSARGRQIDFVAPGDGVLSTFPPNIFARLRGTSMSAPFVAGIVALLISKHRQSAGQTPVNGQNDVIEHLKRSAIDAGAPGFDLAFGHGLVNARTLLGNQPISSSNSVQS